jgi:hypothetical protein
MTVGVVATLRWARPSSVIPALLAVSSLAGCGSAGPTMRTAGVERAIADSILAQHSLHARVSCPPQVSRRAGYAFTCVAAFTVGSYPVTATVTNAAGHVRYANPTPLAALDTAGVERAIHRSILARRRLVSTVTCPTEVLQRAGLAFRCTAVVGGRRYPFAVTEVDGAGHVRYVGLAAGR